VLEELRADVAKMKELVRSLHRRIVHDDDDETDDVLEHLDVPFTDRSGVAALEEKLQDAAYRQCVVSCFFFSGNI